MIALLDDPSIDAVYIALPNGLHYEWAVRSLKAGKHVLLEKPATSNAIEAKKLFALAAGHKSPVLLEAFHYQFHPAWQTFLREVRRAGDVEHVSSHQYVPRGVMKPDDIRFQFSIAGGCLMDLGTYPLSCVRQVMGREPVSQAVDVIYRGLPPGKEGHPVDAQIDQSITATIRTPSGKTARITADLSSSFEWPTFLPQAWRWNIPHAGTPMCEAIMKEVPVDTSMSPDGVKMEHFVQKTVTIWNFMMPVVWHRIDVCEDHKLLKGGQMTKRWKEKKHVKAYAWPEDDEQRAATYPDWWTTWRCQLEEFVHRIKGRKGSGVWIDEKETITQMEAIDTIYQKAGLKIRPTSMYEEGF